MQYYYNNKNDSYEDLFLVNELLNIVIVGSDGNVDDENY